MPDTIWCFEQKEKSLECISRDFFASGIKTLVLLPQQEKLVNNEAFVDYAQGVINKLQQIGQEVVVIGAGNWPCPVITRINGRFVFEDMPVFEVKRRNLMGRFSIQDEVLPILKKVGLSHEFVECSNTVLIGHLYHSSRFGTSGLMSLVGNILSTYSLSQAYMQNPKRMMTRAVAEVIAAKVFPKTALSILWNDNGVVMGKDMVAVESVALRNANISLKDDKLILESVKLDFGDILLQYSFVEGSFIGLKPVNKARVNTRPIWKKDWCSFCMDCLDVCPNGALTKKDKTISVSANCVRCGACVDCCSLDALV